MTKQQKNSKLKKRKACDKTLEDFGRKHYTYINSFLGDQTIRDIIVNSVKPLTKPKYRLHVEYTNENFGDGSHHVLIDDNGVIQCSTNEHGHNRVCYGFQDVVVNKYDTLCQSYSLLLYYNILQNYSASPSDPERHYIIQMEMVKLYREIINCKLFRENMENEKILSYANRKAYWYDIEKSSESIEPISGDIDTILTKINETLDEWESYGYMWFTGDGKWQRPTKRRILGVKT